MRKKIGMEDEDVDPFESFGHGIQSYFKMMEELICVFFIISILFIPVMYLYS